MAPRMWPFRNKELEYVQSVQNNVYPEEFPEGPYGSTAFLDQPIGKSSEWEPGQQVVSRFQDENPAFSDTSSTPPQE